MEERRTVEERTGLDSTRGPPSARLLAVARRGPFTLNSMLLLPLLRSLPVSSGVSLVAAFASLTGLDFGALRLGRPDTAADALVASMMAFSVAVPVFWGVYVVSNGVKWLTAAAADVRSWSQSKQAAKSTPPSMSRDTHVDETGDRSADASLASQASIASLRNAPTSMPPD